MRRRLGERGFNPAPAAAGRELIRRLKFDLLGLPPTSGEIDEFLAEQRPDAYERLVDRYLADPGYGETWGRMWLDLVRFAETAGFNADPHRPLAWKYRDYVIRSFNENKPYDRFVKEQIAGDELFPESEAALVASGYNRMWPDESNASDVLLARQDALNDLTANVGAVFLGLSVGCAQCHNHKFDPILQKDFYSLQAFFAGIVLEDRVPVGTAGELAEYRGRLDGWMDETAALREELHEIESTARAKAGEVRRRKFPQVVLEAIDTAPWKRTALQHQLVFWSDRQIEVNEKQLLAEMSDEQKQRRAELRKKLAELQNKKPQPPRWAKVMATVEPAGAPPETHLLAGGSYEKPLDEVSPAVPVVLRNQESGVGRQESGVSRQRRGIGSQSSDDATDTGQRTPDNGPLTTHHSNQQSPILRPGTSGRRARLALWLTDPSNPLPARVLVNRIWQGHFGRGLVANANDFGTRTPPPSHPELLDWLATEFARGSVVSGWDIKRLHRLIVTSAVYRQSTDRLGDGEETPPDAEAADGDLLYRHFPRQRLSAERIRDSLLAVSGRLYRKMYGPGVKPELPPKFSVRHAWKPSEDDRERNRRSIYIYAKRNLPYPLLAAFDFPDMHESCAERAETTIAPQALMFLNSELVLKSARRMAERVARESSTGDLPVLVRQAYRVAFGRPPDAQELREATEFIRRQARLTRPAAESRGDLPVAARRPDRPTPAEREAFVDFCHALLNANEFLYLD